VRHPTIAAEAAAAAEHGLTADSEIARFAGVARALQQQLMERQALIEIAHVLLPRLFRLPFHRQLEAGPAEGRGGIDTEPR
jgi:hypothetical protein